MANVLRFLKSGRAPVAAGVVHWLLTFILERGILTVSPAAHPVDYAVIKVALLFALVGFWTLIFKAAFGEKGNFCRTVVAFALPYLAVLTVYLVVEHPFTLSGDELNLFTRATELDSFAYWFNYFSGYYWIMGIMLIPHAMGPVVIKVILQALTAGYVLARQARVGGVKSALPLYALFLLPFVMEQGISAHRLPTYGMLLLFFAAKLVYDRAEGKRLDAVTLVINSAVIAVLALWRTEGIYLAPLGVILMMAAYRVKATKKAVKALLCYGLIFALIAAPQLAAYKNAEAPLGLRTKPLCGYILCNMFRNGLTEEMVADEREDIEGYLTLDTVKEYNDKYGDENYYRAIVMYGVNESADYDAQLRFCDGVKSVMIKHPIIYLKAQLGAFRYTNDQYIADFSESVWEGFKNLTCKVWIPALLLAIICIYALIRRNWLTFWLSGGGVCNLVMVVMLMPAAFAKYFYPVYLLGYFLLLFGLCSLIAGKREGKNA